MCPQLGFSLGIYLKHLLCEKFPLVSRGLTVVNVRGHGTEETHCQLASVMQSLGLRPQLPTLSICSLSFYFSLMVVSVLPGCQSPCTPQASDTTQPLPNGQRKTFSLHPVGALGGDKDSCCLKKGQVTACHHFGRADRHTPGPNHSCLPTLPGGPMCQDSLLHFVARKLELLLLLTNFGCWQAEN